MNEEKKRHSEILHWLIKRLVEREKQAAGASDPERTDGKVRSAVDHLKTLLNDMKETCNEIQMRAAQQSAVRVLLVGRLVTVQQYTSVLGAWLQRVKEWPKTENSSDSRSPSLQKTDYIHILVGQQILKLRFKNPLPVPEFGDETYMCVICKTPNLTSAYQLENADGQRDKGTYRPSAAGLDVCVTCAGPTYRRYSRRLAHKIKICPYNTTLRTNSISPGHLTFQSAGFAARDSILLSFKATPGLYVVGAAVSRSAEVTIPAAWQHPHPPFCLKVEDTVWTDKTCSVCMESLMHDTCSNGAPMATPCGHEFHSHCIQTTRRGVDGEQGTDECPNCRAPSGDSSLQVVPETLSMSIVIDKDALGLPIKSSSYYSIVAVMCQDPEWVIPTSAAVATMLLNPEEGSFWS